CLRCFVLLPRPPTSPLFPYTTLFRSELVYDHNHDGVDRRGFLKCMAWAGTGAFCVIRGGVLRSYSLDRLAEMDPKETAGELSFRSEEHTSELQSRVDLVCRLLLEKKN